VDICVVSAVVVGMFILNAFMVWILPDFAIRLVGRSSGWIAMVLRRSSEGCVSIRHWTGSIESIYASVVIVVRHTIIVDDVPKTLHMGAGERSAG